MIERFEKNIKSWKIEVENIATNGERGVKLTSEFESEGNNIEDVLHKVELDLYTNMEYNFKTPIKISIIKVEKRENN